MPQSFAFLLLPGFSALGFIATLEPLRVANRFRPGSYRWRILGREGAAVTASNGMSVNVDGGLDALEAGTTLFVVAGFEPLAHYDDGLASWLRQVARHGHPLGGIDTGALVLARAGLLDGHRITLHWEAVAAFRDAWPQLEVTGELFEIDRGRITCAGGTASLDLLLELIGRSHGSELAVQVSEQFVLGRIRPPREHQRLQVAQRYGIANRKLIRVVERMERHTETPLGTLELAAGIQVTRRQLERLFRLHLQTTPSTFYLQLRLDRARQLLQQGEASVLDVALACGFESASYFSRCYRQRFGLSPREDRPRRSSAPELAAAVAGLPPG